MGRVESSLVRLVSFIRKGYRTSSFLPLMVASLPQKSQLLLDSDTQVLDFQPPEHGEKFCKSIL